MSGTILPLPYYTFVAWCSVKSTGTTLTLPLNYRDGTVLCLRIIIAFSNFNFLKYQNYSFIKVDLGIRN